MSDLLSIGSSAIDAYQRALTTTSNNIANLNTEGYSREEVALSAGTPANRGTIYLGTGVVIDGVKRAYSDFAGTNLRNSYSALNTQDPLVQYANRITDVMGSANSGLAQALDQYFSAAQAVSAAPASSDMRSQYLTSADGVAARFRELASQLDSVATDTREAINANVSELNTLATQLATVNGQLRRNNREANQPPTLLDQRDKLLNDLAKLVGISVQTKTNGEVSVGLGGSPNQGVIVDGAGARSVGAVFGDSSSGKVDIVIDPYGNASNVSNLDGGSLAGLIAFRQQALEPTQNKLDTLAQVFAGEVNKIQTSGIDATGAIGQALFAIDPVYQVSAPASHSGVNVATSVLDPTATAYHDIVLRYDELRRTWSATDTTSNKTVNAASGEQKLTINGVELSISGTPQNAETITLKALQRPAASIHLALNDAQRVAAGALFRAIPNVANTSATTATVTWQPENAKAPGPSALDLVLVNNPHPSHNVDVVNSVNTPISAIAAIPAGFQNINVQLQQLDLTQGPLDLQVFTRDGRQLLGTPLPDGANGSQNLQGALLNTANGFVAGATYSSDYLNQSGDKSYRKLDLFYGARAVPGGDPAFDAANKLTDTRTLRAQIAGASMPAPAGAAGSTFIAAGALTLNGVALGKLAIPPSGVLQASDVAAWINVQTPSGAHVSASAATNISIQASKLLLDGALTINGTAVNGPFANAAALATAINEKSAATFVTASVGLDGGLTLTNTLGHGGENVAIGTPAGYQNALGLNPQTFHGQLTLSSAAELRLGIGANGSGADLARIGLRAGVFLNGTAPEDLLVFATGTGAGGVAAGYQKGTLDGLTTQRAMPLNVTFTAADSYTITDVNTGSVLAQRSYDPQAGIVYGGLSLQLSSPPAAGDQFLIDDNQDGTGNNANMQRIIGLATSKDAMPGGKTMGESYNDILSSVGNVSGQAKIAQQALTVVNQQAIQARDKASGVNIDAEAADLIRFQQAYQAAAKTIQIASQLFDTIVQIR